MSRNSCRTAQSGAPEDSQSQEKQSGSGRKDSRRSSFEWRQVVRQRSADVQKRDEEERRVRIDARGEAEKRMRYELLLRKFLPCLLKQEPNDTVQRGRC